MNAVLSLSHFCETHGPTLLFSTQAFHFAGEDNAGLLQPSGVRFFGCVKKLEDYKTRVVQNIENVVCEACEAISGYITNDYQNKISFLSTRLPIDSNVSSLMKQAAVRSLSCEVVPEKEGQVYFGDSARGHILSNTFFLKDAQARGFHRWYSVVVFMKDKHLLLNSWPFFEKHITQIVKELQKKATRVYSDEQNVCSQRLLRLSNADQKHSTARSLIKLTDSGAVFAQLHTWFTWLLSTGAKRLEEYSPTRLISHTCNDAKKTGLRSNGIDFANPEDCVWHLKQLRRTLGAYDFNRIIYSTLIGRQVIVRGPKLLVDLVINLLRLILPDRKFRCENYCEFYKAPDVCNILGLDLYAAVPKSSDKLVRLDIVPKQELDNNRQDSYKDAYNCYSFILKNESKLPDKWPSLLIKIDKALSDETLSDRASWLHISSLIEQWHHTADVVREAKKKCSDVVSLLQTLNIQDSDEPIIGFWAS